MRLPSPRWWTVPAVLAGSLALYRLGTAPGLLWSDSAEMQTLAGVGGVAHPSGYPLFTLLAQPFVRLLHGEPAFLANLFSGVFAAATLALLAAFLLGRGLRVPAVIAAVLAWGTSFTFWTTSHRAEVYSQSAFMGLLGLWCALAALERGGRAPRLAAGLLLGLALSGHLAFAPFVAVAGLTLAWRVPRTGIVWLVDELALLGAFLLGLSPYLYLVWADTHRVGLDYLHLVDIVQWPEQPVPASFRPPFARLWWLITSRNIYPTMPFNWSPRFIAKNLSDTSCLLALFELGPLNLALAAFGARTRLAGPHRGEARLLLSLAAASIVFTILTGGYKLLAVFLIPCFLAMAVLVGFGAEALIARLEPARGRRLASLAVLALPLASTLIGHSVRLATYEHPIGPFKSRVLEEDDIRQTHLVPTFAGYDEPRRFAESAAAKFPDSALVISGWSQGTTLFYLQLVEKRRTDLTIQPSGYPMLLKKVAAWQGRYALTRRPVVVVGGFADMGPHLDHPDTLVLATGEPVLIARRPLVRLDRP